MIYDLRACSNNPVCVPSAESVYFIYKDLFKNNICSMQQ